MAVFESLNRIAKLVEKTQNKVGSKSLGDEKVYESKISRHISKGGKVARANRRKEVKKTRTQPEPLKGTISLDKLYENTIVKNINPELQEALIRKIKDLRDTPLRQSIIDKETATRRRNAKLSNKKKMKGDRRGCADRGLQKTVMRYTRAGKAEVDLDTLVKNQINKQLLEKESKLVQNSTTEKNDLLCEQTIITETIEETIESDQILSIEEASDTSDIEYGEINRLTDHKKETYERKANKLNKELQKFQKLKSGDTVEKQKTLVDIALRKAKGERVFDSVTEVKKVIRHRRQLAKKKKQK